MMGQLQEWEEAQAEKAGHVRVLGVRSLEG